MHIYFAPLQGITDVYFRQIHADHFSGVAKYFIPFISPTQNYNLTNQELREVNPANAKGFYVVPQIIASNPDLFLWAARQLADLGYTEINLNLGCPSGTVTAKGKGAGLLTSLTKLEMFLDEVYTHCPVSVTIKTRIGWQSPDEFPGLIECFNNYPIPELIVHGRTRAQFYKGNSSISPVLDAIPLSKNKIVYNGDLYTPAACTAFFKAHPEIDTVMIGRGLAANPALARTVLGHGALTIEEIRSYHDALYRCYLGIFPKNAALGRMREVGKHLACCFEDARKPLKTLRKAATLTAYENAISSLFEHPLSLDPGFLPEQPYHSLEP